MPEIISTVHPVAERTHSRKAWELRASRKALVADHANCVCAGRLHCAMKAAQHFYRMRHGVRRKQSVAKDGFTQARDFAIF